MRYTDSEMRVMGSGILACMGATMGERGIGWASQCLPNGLGIPLLPSRGHCNPWLAA